MIAVPERVLGRGLEPDRLVWHKPVGGVVQDFQAIACSDEEGLVLPAGERDVPLDLRVPGESWCVECLSLVGAVG
ncbi:hypothetical protein [Streptacidiphilus monticola]|uniref:Uncharacterized protein n=1 Tax=Streptacidiphilus monticola TaxID=2161674 RepID=A0ABW1G9N1_9ACTN